MTNSTDRFSYTVSLTKVGYSHLKSIFVTLQAKAMKLNLDNEHHPILTVAKPRLVFDSVRGRDVEMFDVTITGKLPVIDGWMYIGTILPLNDDANAVALSPGIAPHIVTGVPKMFHTQFICQHCQLLRARASLFLLYKESTNEYKSVGSTCMENFVGQSVSVFLDTIKLLDDLHMLVNSVSKSGEMDGDIISEWGVRVHQHDLTDILIATSKCIAAFGWTSVTMAMENPQLTPTKETVLDILNGRLDDKDIKFMDRRLSKAMYSHEDTLTEVNAAIEWAKTLSESNNSYLVNLSVLANAGISTDRALGVACSLIPAYRRELSRKAEMMLAARLSAKLGVVGEKLTLTNVVITGRSVFENRYGTTTLIVMRYNNNVLTWWASNPPASFSIGATIPKLTGTVKGYQDYNGVTQTILTRVKELE